MGYSTSNEQKQGLHCLVPSIQGPNSQNIGLFGWGTGSFSHGNLQNLEGQAGNK